MTADGTPIRIMLNISDPRELAGLDPSICDGIGLVRTELLFHDRHGLPGEEQQYGVYRQIAEWAQGRPVTIRTLDAGGDKSIPGLTPARESNPFLGVRGMRLSLARPDVFRTQLRALARAAMHGDLRIMLPMVTQPRELALARGMLDDEISALTAAGVPARRPSLGIMVEVPAAAIAADRFDADFFSIGSNDLTQYAAAAGRDIGAVADLSDPVQPAMLRLYPVRRRRGAPTRHRRELMRRCGRGRARHPHAARCGIALAVDGAGARGSRKTLDRDDRSARPRRDRPMAAALKAERESGPQRRV